MKINVFVSDFLNEYISHNDCYDDITDLTDNKINITLSKENINLMLIGNSMYHYNFISDYGLGKYLNAALTRAQKTKAAGL